MKTLQQFQESAALKLIGRVGLPAARSAINALSSSQRIKAGLKSGEALSKTAGKVTKGGASATSVRAARAARTPVPTQEPGKYLKMQQARRSTAVQGSLLTRAGKAQNFKGGRTPFVATDPTPLPVSRRLPAAKSTTSPGQLELDFTPKPPKKTSGLTHTIRAVESPAEKAGQTRYPGLRKYTSPVPVTKTKKKPNLVGPAIAAGAGTLAALDAEKTNREMQKKQKAFEEFMHESALAKVALKAAKPAAEVLSKISRAYGKKYRGVNVDASVTKSGDIQLNNLWLPPQQRNQGIGSRAMTGLTRYADREGRRITLNQAPEKGKKAALQRFYQSYGFQSNRGRSRDFTTRDTYIRNPQTNP
jgi:GNAT superfamily N-acetyltransferase